MSTVAPTLVRGAAARVAGRPVAGACEPGTAAGPRGPTQHRGRGTVLPGPREAHAWICSTSSIQVDLPVLHSEAETLRGQIKSVAGLGPHREVVLAACRSSGGALEFALHSLRNDREVCRDSRNSCEDSLTWRAMLALRRTGHARRMRVFSDSAFPYLIVSEAHHCIAQAMTLSHPQLSSRASETSPGRASRRPWR